MSRIEERPLRNSRESLLTRLVRFSKRQSRLIFLPIQGGCAPLVAFAGQRGARPLSWRP